MEDNKGIEQALLCRRLQITTATKEDLCVDPNNHSYLVGWNKDENLCQQLVFILVPKDFLKAPCCLLHTQFTSVTVQT